MPISKRTRSSKAVVPDPEITLPEPPRPPTLSGPPTSPVPKRKTRRNVLVVNPNRATVIPEISLPAPPLQTSDVVPKRKLRIRCPVIIPDYVTVIPGALSKPTEYHCTVCRKTFKTKAHIKYHAFCQNGTKPKPFQCKQCKQEFVAKSHYEYHLRTHTGERPYVCERCGKAFNQRSKLTRHTRIHTGEKPVICSECGRGFYNKQALRSHHLIHTGERPFACKLCPKRFTGMTNLKKHMIMHTGERPFICKHCGKGYGLKWTLDIHLRTHSSEKPYVCNVCSRGFTNKKDLRRHASVHTGKRPHKCVCCQWAFARRDNLIRHLKDIHDVDKNHDILAFQLKDKASTAKCLASTEKARTPVSNLKAAAIPVCSTLLIGTDHCPRTAKNHEVSTGSDTVKLPSFDETFKNYSFQAISNLVFLPELFRSVKIGMDSVDMESNRDDTGRSDCNASMPSLNEEFQNELNEIKSNGEEPDADPVSCQKDCLSAFPAFEDSKLLEAATVHEQLNDTRYFPSVSPVSSTENDYQYPTVVETECHPYCYCKACYTGLNVLSTNPKPNESTATLETIGMVLQSLSLLSPIEDWELEGAATVHEQLNDTRYFPSVSPVSSTENDYQYPTVVETECHPNCYCKACYTGLNVLSTNPKPNESNATLETIGMVLQSLSLLSPIEDWELEGAATVHEQLNDTRYFPSVSPVSSTENDYQYPTVVETECHPNCYCKACCYPRLNILSTTTNGNEFNTPFVRIR